jgi:hypothetical protein
MAEEYRIGSGFTERELATASWWVRHHLGLRKALFIGLIGTSILTWGYTAWSLLDAYAISYPRERRIPVIIARDQFFPAGIVQSAPQPLQPTEVNSFPNTENRQDLWVELTNPNLNWWAEFRYQFQTGETKTEARKSFILPGSTKSLTELGWSGNLSSPNLIVENIVWHHTDPNVVGADYDAYAVARLPFTFEDPVYKSDLVVGTKTVGQTDFILRNPSGFGYWSVELTIILYRDTTPIAINTITQRQIKPGEVRPVSLNWFENPIGVTRTEVRASVNILDPQSFLPSERF